MTDEPRMPDEKGRRASAANALGEIAPCSARPANPSREGPTTMSMNNTGIDEQQGHLEQESRAAKRARARREGGSEGRGIDLKRLQEVGGNLASQVTEQARKRPTVALGAAAGLGFVAGSLFGSRLGQMCLAAAIGYVARNAFENGDLGVQRLQENLEKISRERVKG